LTLSSSRSRLSERSLADQELVVTHAVEVAGVEQRDAALDRLSDGGEALVTIGRTVEVRHAHATESGARCRRAGASESMLFHDQFLPLLCCRWKARLGVGANAIPHPGPPP
jgi:hypothetical protein